MGPRLVGRGKLKRRNHEEKTSKASMGPRLVGRGKALLVLIWYLWIRRFNGAASCGTRKEKHSPPIPKTVAASMGPRLVGRGKSNGRIRAVLVGGVLQWGRVLWDAESTPAVHQRSFGEEASMGPRLVGRGKVWTVGYTVCGNTASMGPRLVGRGKPTGSV